MKNSLNNDNKDSKFNIDAVVEFCKSHVKHISAGVLTLILVVVLAVSAINSNKDDGKKEGQKAEQQEKEKTEEYEVNKNQDLQKLIENYYVYSAEGNVKKLEKIAKPFTDMEKSYTKMMSGFIDSYEDVTCYTKKGLVDGSYMVSVTFGMKFQDVKGALPGMDFFYVETNEDGKLYIDNLYSSFNSQMQEQETESEVMALIEKFKEDADVKELQADFQNRYTKAVSSDKKMQKMVDKVTAGIKEWAASYVAKDVEDEKKKAEAEDEKKKTEAEQKKAEAEDEKKKTEAEQKKAEEDKKKTEAEQKKADEDKKKAEAEQKKADEDKKKAEAEQKKTEEEKKADEQTDNSSGVNYVPEGKVLTANDAYNLRATMSETGELMGTVPIGDSIKVVLSYEEGWTKVEWNDKIGYIKTELLLNN